MNGGGVQRGGPEWVVVAVGARLRGSKGLVTAKVISGGMASLAPGVRLRFVRSGTVWEGTLHSFETYGDKVVLSMDGVGSAPQAAELVGSDIFLQRKDLVDLPQGTHYIFRLVGMRVFAPGNRLLGRIVDVAKTGGTDLLVVRGEGDQELLIPFARSICPRIDLEADRVDIDPPEGLLEINAV